jgi:4-hydroxy-tetrahydrodipicolinate synthase
MMELKGIYLPIITPFRDGKIDIVSFRRLVGHYKKTGIAGIIIAATTGEGPVLDDDEYRLLLDSALECSSGTIAIMAGASGNNTRELVGKISRLRDLPLSGILSATPYYNLPDQRGIFEHFRVVAESTELPVVLYNIPGRTGRNMENDTIRRLAEIDNIAGLKDSCADINQSMDLLLNPPDDFSILAGHDAHFFLNLSLGGSGGILSSAHIQTDKFVELHGLTVSGDFIEARKIWKHLMKIIPLLFREPNPAPVKRVLALRGLISSDEVRLPLLGITETLGRELEEILTEFGNNSL